jgi:hypothetical protein
MAGPWEQYGASGAAPAGDEAKPWTRHAPRPQASVTTTPPPVAKRPSRSIAQAAGDTVLGVARGAVNMLSGAAALEDISSPRALASRAGIATGAAALRGLGQDNAAAAIEKATARAPKPQALLNDVGAAIDTRQSEALQQSKQELADTEGFWASAGKVVTDPRLLGNFLAEQVPNLALAGAGTAAAGGRAATAAGAQALERAMATGLSRSAATAVAKKAGEQASRQAASRFAVASNTTMETGAATNQAYLDALNQPDQVWQANEDYQRRVAGGEDPDYVKQSLATTAATRAAAVAAPISAVAGRVSAPFEADVFTGQLARRPVAIAGGIAREAAEEGVQEGGSQLATNLGVQAIDAERGAFEGVAEAAGTGAALGGVMGGGLATGGALANRPQPTAPSQEPPPLPDRTPAEPPPLQLRLPPPDTFSVDSEGNAQRGRVRPEVYADPKMYFPGGRGMARPFVPGVARRPQPTAAPAGEITRAANPAATTVTAPPPRYADAAPGSIADTANFLPSRPSVATETKLAAEYAAQQEQATQDAKKAEGAAPKQEAAPAPAPTIDTGRRLSPLPWVNDETGEFRKPTADEVKLAIHERMNLAIANGGMANKPVLRQSLGLHSNDFDAAYNEVKRERRQGLTAPAPAAQPADADQRVRDQIQANRQTIRGDDETTNQSEGLSLAEAEPQDVRGADPAALPAAGRTLDSGTLPASEEPAADDAGAAVRAPEGVEAAPAEAAQAGSAATYDESAELLDSDITPPSGGPFAQRAAADVQARRVEGGRVFEVDGGFVVRTPQAVIDTSSVGEQVGATAQESGSNANESEEAVPAGVQQLAAHEAALPAPDAPGLSVLRGEGGDGVSAVDAQLSDVPAGSGPAEARDVDRQGESQRQLRAGELPVGDGAATGGEPAVLPQGGGGRPADDSAGSRPVDGAASNDAPAAAASAGAPVGDGGSPGAAALQEGLQVHNPRRGNAKRAGVGKAVGSAVEDTSRTPAPTGADGEGAPAKRLATLGEVANEAATSPTNDLAEPTAAQKEVGNYRKAHVRINGHDISIENPAGSKRRPEWPALKNHYGYIRGTVGKDKDHVDVFLTDRADDTSLPVFVVDQLNADGSLDEHKVIMGAATEEEARKTYLANYSKGWTGLGGIKQFTQEEFKAWVRDPVKTKRRVTRAPRSGAAVVTPKPKRAAASTTAPPDSPPEISFSKPEDQVPVVQAERLGTDAQSLWQEADRAYRKTLQGTTVEGPDGRVRFSNVGRTKALSIGRRDPLRMGVALKLGELVKVARVYDQAQSTTNIAERFAYAVAPVEVDGQIYAVKMTYRATPQMEGDRSFYTFEGYEIEDPGAIDRGRGADAPLALRGSPGSAFSVAELVQAFNPDRRAFAQPPTSGSDTGLPFDRALELKAELTKEWGDAAPAVVVVRNAEGFPDSAKADPDYTRAEGFYDGRPTVWINAATITSERRFAEVLAHEAIGHYGVERILGKKEWGSIVDAIGNLATTGDASDAMLSVLADVRRRYGDLDPSTYASEVLAVMAERGIRNSLINRLVAAVRRFLRRVMPSTASWSENDLRALLAQSESFLRAGRNLEQRQRAVQAYSFSKVAITVDARGERSISMGGEKFVERGNRYYLVNGTGHPKDFETHEDAWQVAQRTGAEVTRDDYVDGEPQTFSVVVPDDDVRVAAASRRFFSKPADDVIADIDAVQRGVHAEGVLARARQLLADAVPKKLKDTSRPTWLGALTTRHLTELGADYFSDIKHYSDDLTKMQADRNTLQAQAEGIAENARKWASKNRAAARQLFDLMHEATIDGVDPAESYKPFQFRWAERLHDATDKNVREAILGIKQQMRERSGDSKKDMLERIKALNAMRHAEKRRASTYGGMVARWNQLSPEAQQLYRDMRDAYRQRSDAMEEALVKRIADLKGDGVSDGQIKKMSLTIRQQFEDNRLQGVYFPLQRFGRYFVSATKGDDNTFLMFESGNDLERAVKELRGRGWTIGAQGLKGEAKSKEAPPGGFVADIIGQLHKNGVSEKTQDDIYQIYLQALPELSMRKHQIHRKSVPGFDTDAVRAFAYNMHHGSHQLARLRYSHLLQMTLDKLRKDQDAARRLPDADTRKIVAGDAIIDELGRRHEWIMNPQDSQLTNIVSSLGFTYYLGATPAAALVNLTQTALVTYPYLASRHGPIKAMNYLLAASRDAARTLGNIQKTLTTDEERAAHAALMASGALDKTQAHNLAGIAEGGLAGYNPAWAKTMEWIGIGFHKTEVINREASAMAAFRLARSDGASFDEAVKSAHDAVFDTHFDYSNANRARFMQSGTAKVLLMFRQYSLNMTWTLGRMVWQATKGQTPEVKRIARRNLAGVLGMSSLFSGVLGLPTMGVVMGTLNALQSTFGDDDEPWDAETEFRAFLADMLGKPAAALVTRGAANTITGADIAGRVGLSELWVRDADRELEGRGLYYHLLEQAAGPMGGVLKNVLVGKALIDEGHTMRGVETMLPKSLKDIFKAGRYATQGVNTLRGDPLIEDLSLWSTLLQLNGFSPAEVSEQYERNRALKNYEQHIVDRRQHLMNAFALALRTGDAQSRQATIQKIQAFNRANPELAITSASIARSIQSRARYSAKAEAGIVINPKLAARLNAAVGE